MRTKPTCHIALFTIVVAASFAHVFAQTEKQKKDRYTQYNAVGIVTLEKLKQNKISIFLSA